MIWGPKCILCSKRSGGCKEISWVEEYGHYNMRRKAKGWYYHQGCLKDALCNPEKYGHKRVDIAMEIVDRIDTKRSQMHQDQMAVLDRDLKRRSKNKQAFNRTYSDYL